MKYSIAATSLLFSAGAVAAAAKNNNNKDATRHLTIAPKPLQRVLEQIGGIPEGDGKCMINDLSDETRKAAQKFQKWFVETYLGNKYILLKDKEGPKLDYVYDLFDTYDVNGNGVLDPAEIATMGADIGVSTAFLADYINCLFVDQGLDEDELLKAVCVGEPHFTTWQGANFDYHGECDLVLIQNSSFDDFKGMDLHVRTEQMESGVYSYVSNAALRIGSDTFEIQKDGSVYYNKKQVDGSAFPLTIGEYPATYKVEDKCFDIGPIHRCLESTTVDVTLGSSDEVITFKVFKNMVHVEVKGRPSVIGVGSRGLMGTYPGIRHGRIARDGITLMQDANEFGQEWQVSADEAKLFVDSDRYPQAPNAGCIPASEDHAEHTVRHLMETDEILVAKATEACEFVIHDSQLHSNCIFDVMATGDEDHAMIYGAW